MFSFHFMFSFYFISFHFLISFYIHATGDENTSLLKRLDELSNLEHQNAALRKEMKSFKEVRIFSK